MTPRRKLSRRKILTGSAAGVAAAVIGPTASADADRLAKAIADIAGANVPTSRVKLIIPELAENGNVVSVQIEVASPMTAADHVKTVHLLSETNPNVLIARFHFTPRSGRARVATNIRLASSQRVVAIAEMNDGRCWLGDANIIVTLAACVDGG